MRCRVCGGLMQRGVTDLPFKQSDRSIVVIKNLPVLLCENCTEYSVEDPVMATVEQILDAADEAAELSVVKYAA
ncbi:MAG: type II toxin-antitoxin system MqsA family antitoxin [Nitrospira defluvii]|nr:type II toxin-antitoxin system MqsA family antitoxin [Nitrospira defluvii]